MIGLLLVFLAAAPSKADFQVVRILYTSDLHGRSRPSADFASVGLPRRTLGGWVGLAGLIDSERTDATLLLDCGDFAFGSPEADSAQGRASIRFMNQVRYDAAVPGARDFAGGISNVEVLAKAAGFLLLADPMLDVVLNRQVPLFRPYVIKTVKGVRVAVVGITDPEIPVVNRRDDTRGLAVEPALAQLARYLPAVRADSAEIIVVIGHISTAAGCAIADSTTGITVVLCSGGQGLVQNQLPCSTGTPVLAAGAYGQRLGVVDILFHKTERKVYQCESRILNVEAAGTETPVLWGWLPDLVGPSWDSAATVSEQEFVPDSSGRLRLGFLVAEAVRQKAGADVAVLPTSIIESGIRAGGLSRYEAFSVAPYSERLRLVVADDTTLARLVAPESADQDGPAPLLAGADYFAVCDSTAGWPLIADVARARLRNRQTGPCKVVTTEQWLQQAGLQVESRLLPQSLTEMWLDFAAASETLPRVEPVRLYVATPGVVRSSPAGPININTADSELLQTLPGIGPKTAERLIEYRQSVGRFKSTEEIQNVSGIGPKKYEKLKPLITVR